MDHVPIALPHRMTPSRLLGIVCFMGIFSFLGSILAFNSSYCEQSKSDEGCDMNYNGSSMPSFGSEHAVSHNDLSSGHFADNEEGAFSRDPVDNESSIFTADDRPIL